MGLMLGAMGFGCQGFSPCGHKLACMADGNFISSYPVINCGMEGQYFEGKQAAGHPV
jgi:hypothetical protein